MIYEKKQKNNQEKKKKKLIKEDVFIMLKKRKDFAKKQPVRRMNYVKYIALSCNGLCL
jgi:hypothetical protein